jgi:hypothetical protein
MPGTIFERSRRRSAAGAGISLAALLGLAGSAHADTAFVVDDSTDAAGVGSHCTDGTATNNCTLRDAITQANSNADHTAITFAAGITGTITLGATGQLPVSTEVYVEGPGADKLTISGNHASRVFNVSGGAPVKIEDLTIANGQTASGNPGAGIRSLGTTLTVARCAMTGNISGAAGGAISWTEAGHDYGLVVDSSTLSGNTATYGGAISAFEANGYPYTHVVDSTITGNHATFAGGAINFGNVPVVDAMYPDSTLLVKTSTITGNTGGASQDGGVATVAGDAHAFVDLYSSIVFNNGAPAYAVNHVHGFESLIPAGVQNLQHNIVGADPKLGPLQNNGGPTQTMKPAADSPVIDQGASGSSFGGGFGALTTDQRGQARVVDFPLVANNTAGGADGSDMGAVELTSAEGPQPAIPAPPSAFDLQKALKKCKKKKSKKARKKCVKKAKKRAKASV